MEIIKTYKYRLRLSKAQESVINSWINTSRAVYNLALETKMYAYKSHRISLSKFVCTSCGVESNADYNASKVIFKIGLAQLLM